MREYSAKEQKILLSNPYTYKVTKHKLYFTKEFKQDFWLEYQAGIAPRKVLVDLGYDVEMFGQKQIDSIVQNIKKTAMSGKEFTEGTNRDRRTGDPLRSIEKEIKGKQLSELEESTAIERLLAEVKYLRQEVEFLKKITKTENSKKRRLS